MGEENAEEQEVVGPTSTTHDLEVTAASLTPAQFLSWKRQKDANESAMRAEAARKRQEDIRAGLVQMNGRELFLNEPWVFDNTLY